MERNHVVRRMSVGRRLGQPVSHPVRPIDDLCSNERQKLTLPVPVYEARFIILHFAQFRMEMAEWSLRFPCVSFALTIKGTRKRQ